MPQTRASKNLVIATKSKLKKPKTKQTSKTKGKNKKKGKSRKQVLEDDKDDNQVDEVEAVDSAKTAAAEKPSVDAIIDFLNSTLNFGKEYQVLELLGKGKWAFAFKARVRATGAPVAVKIMVKGEMDLIPNEKNMLVKLATSPYVPKVLDYFKSEVSESGDMCADILVMPLYGKSLKEATAHGCAVDILLTSAQMFRCLESIHELNVVHGDVSPGNFLLTDEKKLILADFGNAQELPLAFGEEKSPEVEGSLEFTSLAVDCGKTAMPLDDVEAAALIMLKIQQCRDLPWADEKNAKKRALMKDLKNLRMYAPDVIYDLIVYLRKLNKQNPAAVPDYFMIFHNICENTREPPRKAMEYTAEQHFRIHSSKAQRLTDIPFVSREIAEILKKHGFENPAALFALLSTKFVHRDLGYAEAVRASTAAFERFLTSLKIKQGPAEKIARVFVPAKLMF